MEPLPDGWRKERYSLLEAERIVAYWRYGAPHPGTDAQPSREAKRSAREDLKRITSFEEKEAAIVAPPGPFLPDDPWLNPRGGWGAEAAHQSQAIRRAVRRVPYITRDDLETLCPGLFRDPSEALRSEVDSRERTRTSTTREDRLSVAIVAALEALRARLRREPKAAEVFAYLEEDPTGIVVDSTDEKLTWVSESGTLHDTKRKTVANRISKLRKAT